MSNSTIDIIPPITETITNTFNKLFVKNTTLILNEKAIFQVVLIDNETIIKEKQMIMSGNDYLNWNGTDDYAINWIITNLR